ncbi:FCD domain-containing protein (plasmid) [Marinobacter sp. M3C]|uniref:FCD domain-containing protein n=1 Tax=Marinobacter sp. M3C TaxID=2917715 RepID=UPI00200DEEA8|nr:FCD domain-containing protein [Marinobacter sp. M3C]UQG62717.1 FCD domain-containing protein [Marinobacter sp. M3C]
MQFNRTVPLNFLFVFIVEFWFIKKGFKKTISKGLPMYRFARVIDNLVVEAATRAGNPKIVPALIEHLEAADAEPSKTRLAHAIDLTFEQIIGDFCGNVYLAALQREAHGYFRAAWEGAGLMPRPADERSQQHWHIFDAIRFGDAVEARHRMEEHFRLQALAPTVN